MTLDTHLAHPPREGTLQSGILSEALTLQESDTKENTHVDSIAHSNPTTV